ncbi:MAG TPA: winged helix-turn-helix domain-containing protein [Euzebya sp.]|nr:winged helix-turn-helix domain-containing protein [Euzebya sp.]
MARSARTPRGRTRRPRMRRPTSPITSRSTPSCRSWTDGSLAHEKVPKAWGYDYDPESNVVDVYVGYLRKKIGKQRIATVRGMGYRMDPG